MENLQYINILKKLIAKNRTEEVLEMLMSLSEELGGDFQKEILSLSSQFTDVKTKERLNLPFQKELLNKVNYSILQKIDTLNEVLNRKEEIEKLNIRTEELKEDLMKKEKRAFLKVSISISIGAAITIALSFQIGVTATVLLIITMIILSFIYAKFDELT